MKTVEQWKTALRSKLRDALKARQNQTVAVLRETLAAIENAEAPPVGAIRAEADGVFAGSVQGLRAGEVPRLVLSPEAVATLIQREIRERREAAAEYTKLGRAEEASKLAAQAEVLEALGNEPG